MRRLISDHDNIGPNLLSYVERVSYEVRDVFDRLAFTEQIHRTLRQGLRTLLGAPVAQGNFLLRQPLA